MMQKQLSKLEITGSFVAFLCAVHCVSIPLLLSFGSIGAVKFIDHLLIELLFLATTMTIAGWSIFANYKRKSVNALPISLFAFGFTCLIISVIFHLHMLSAVGGILIATAHYFNYRQLHVH